MRRMYTGESRGAHVRQAPVRKNSAGPPLPTPVEQPLEDSLVEGWFFGWKKLTIVYARKPL